MDSGLARSLSSGARSRDPLARPGMTGFYFGNRHSQPTQSTDRVMTASPEVAQDGVLAGPLGPAIKGPMDRFIDSIEWIAAFFVGIVALNTFTAVVMRKFFAITIPDYYNFGQFMLGILIFWGIAATSYRGSHITVDLVWANATPKHQRWIDVFATLVLLFVVTVQTYTLFDKVVSTRAAHIVTMDLQLPIWPFFLVSWLGDVSAVLLIAIRTWRLIFHPDQMHDPKIKTVE
jgi:TRAP-type C4-dicarboxylate transport system permease small subunit